MIITSSDFYLGLMPKDILCISFFENNDDFFESTLEVVYRVTYELLKVEASFFKKSGELHYIQMEECFNSGDLSPIKIIDDLGIFERKNKSWIAENIGEAGEGIVLYFDNDNLLQSLTYIPGCLSL